MKRGLLFLIVSVCLCAPAWSQADSGMQTVPATALSDTGRSIVPDTHSMPAASAAVNAPVNEPAEVVEPSDEKPNSQLVYWLVGAGLLGILLGAFGYRLLFRKKENGMMIDTLQSDATTAEELEAQRNLEQEIEDLRAQNALFMADNEQLKRDKAELEQLLHTAKSDSGMSENGSVKETIFYMPQPNMNGRFQEASRRDDAANALYAFRVQADEPGIASFEFIAKDAYLNAAIGNEPSWIAIACDRHNQPSVSTTGVRTDVPGMAYLQDGEWAITRKAKITYL